MKKIGKIDMWFETGTEGVCWIFSEKGKRGWSAFNEIEKGDHLKIYNENGKVVFSGIIRPDSKIGWQEYPRNPGFGQPVALGYRIHWTQKGWKPDDWARLFIRRKGEKLLRAELTPHKSRKQ